MAAQSIYSSLEALSTPEATKLAWTRLGKTCEAEGAVLTKVRGGSYPRHATNGRLLTTGLHVWEYEFTSAAKANGNRTMYVGVAQEGLDVEKGGHSKSGKAWYLRTDNGTLYGSGGAEAADQTPVEKCFVVGDKIGVTLNLGDGALAFSKNGVLLAGGFPAGRITGPVVGAVELLTVGQSLTLLKSTEKLLAQLVPQLLDEFLRGAVELLRDLDVDDDVVVAALRRLAQGRRALALESQLRARLRARRHVDAERGLVQSFDALARP